MELSNFGSHPGRAGGLPISDRTGNPSLFTRIRGLRFLSLAKEALHKFCVHSLID